ncbi:MAG: Eco57I restriction-modification methylase domain-containing protein, partial [Candidatus Hodarchaeales archaeon]
MLRLEKKGKDSNKTLSHHIHILKKLFKEIKNLDLELKGESHHNLWFKRIIIIYFVILNFLGLELVSKRVGVWFENWEEAYTKHSNPLELIIHLDKHYFAIPDLKKMMNVYQVNEKNLTGILEKINWIKYAQSLNQGYNWIKNYALEGSLPPNSITFELFDKLLFFIRDAVVTDGKAKQGIVYTPYNLAMQIVERSIDNWIKSNKNSFNITQGYSKIRILDPSVGTGVFLIAAGNLLTKILVVSEKKGDLLKFRKKIVKDNLFGLDIDPLGIYITKIKLFLWISEEEYSLDQKSNVFSNIRIGDTLFGFNEYTESSFTKEGDLSKLPIEFDEQSVKKVGIFQIQAEKTLKEKIQTLNTIKKEIVNIEGFQFFILEGFQEEWNRLKSNLDNDIRKKVIFSKIDYYSKSNKCYAIFDKEWINLNYQSQNKLKPYHFSSSFHWIDKNFGVKFDLIIGNPPFIALTDLSMLSRIKLQNFYPEVYNGNCDLVNFFIIRNFDFISPNGVIGFLLPKYIMTSIHSKNIRQFILNNFKILEIHDFNDKTIFPSFGVKTIFLLLKRSEISKNHHLKLFRYSKSKKNSTELLIKPQSK